MEDDAAWETPSRLDFLYRNQGLSGFSLFTTPLIIFAYFCIKQAAYGIEAACFTGTNKSYDINE